MHTVLFTITLPSRLTLLFTYVILLQCDIFSQLLHNWHYTNVYSKSMYTGFAVYICFPFQHVIFFLNYCIIYSTTVFTAYPQHMHTALFTITLPSGPTLLFTYASFSQYDIFSQLLPNWLYNNVYSISSTYTYGICLQLHYPVYWLCCLYMLPFHNVIFFHNHCPIHSTTMFTAYTQHIHTVLFTITPPSILYVLLHMLPFHNVIFFHNHCTIDSTTMSIAYPRHMHTVLFTITLPSRLTLLFTYASFSQYDIFSQLLPNWLYNNVYSIYSTYTYSTIYNYTTQYTNFAVYICCPFHNVIFFHNYCPIDSTTMFTAYTQHIHTVLFTITLPSTLTLLFTYASFSQYDIFSQLLSNWLYNNVYSIYSTYPYGTVYNYTTQYTRFAVYICFPFHNVIFFLNHCIIHSTTVFTAYPQHMHTVLFTITLPSRLTLLFTYVILFTMWYFFTITAQLALHQCLQHIRNIYI